MTWGRWRVMSRRIFANSLRLWGRAMDSFEWNKIIGASSGHGDLSSSSRLVAEHVYEPSSQPATSLKAWWRPGCRRRGRARRRGDTRLGHGAGQRQRRQRPVRFGKAVAHNVPRRHQGRPQQDRSQPCSASSTACAHSYRRLRLFQRDEEASRTTGPIDELFKFIEITRPSIFPAPEAELFAAFAVRKIAST